MDEDTQQRLELLADLAAASQKKKSLIQQRRDVQDHIYDLIRTGDAMGIAKTRLAKAAEITKVRAGQIVKRIETGGR